MEDGRLLTQPVLQVCDNKSYKSKEPPELVGSSPHREASPMSGTKEVASGKDMIEEDLEATPSKTSRNPRKGDLPVAGE